jgi:glycerol-3-phosphate dehydrogenase
MICFGPNGEKTLRGKYAQGLENGARGLRLLSAREVLELEPNLNPKVSMGLYAPEAGTVLPWELCIAAAESAVQNGADLILNTRVTAVERLGEGYRVTAGGRVFMTRGVVNCAGLFADEVLEMAQPPSIRLYPTSADYFVLDTKAAGVVRRVVFHESEDKGKGLTLVPTVDGNILVGPSEVPADGKDGYATTREGLDWLSRLAPEVIPALPMEHVIRSFGALRPNPFYVAPAPLGGGYVREDRGISNFIVHESERCPAFLSLIGIKTPGLTCAGELGSYAAGKMAALLGAPPNPDFVPNRSAPLRLGELTLEQRARLAKENPAYGRLVCRCRGITEGEILDSVRRSPGAVTVDGVKRRTGATSGRCQGGFCTQRILELIARELGVPPQGVMKDGPGSYVIGGDLP